MHSRSRELYDREVQLANSYFHILCVQSPKSNYDIMETNVSVKSYFPE